MSMIEHRRNPRSDTWRVRFRHQGKNMAKPFATEQAALAWQKVLDAHGPVLALRLLAEDRRLATERTVSQQVEHHIAHLTNVTDGTRAKYRKILKSRIDPTFRHVLLEDLTRDHVTEWVNAQTCAPKTTRNALHGVLSPALNSAVREGLIPSNPARGVAAPKRTADAGEHIYLTHEEYAHLETLIAAHWLPLVRFLVGTGMRFNEAAALTVGSVSLADRSARVKQAWKDTAGGTPVLGPPKTAKSRRTVALPAEVVDVIRPLVEGRKSSEFVFTNTRGNPVRNGQFHETVWQRAAVAMDDRYGKKPWVHDLRHTFASWALSAGVPITVVQRQLGHESIQTTVDTYGSLVRSDLDVLAGRIGAMLPRATATITAPPEHVNRDGIER